MEDPQMQSKGCVSYKTVSLKVKEVVIKKMEEKEGEKRKRLRKSR